MKFDPSIHRRRTIRLPGYDYTQPGAYFVTIVNRQREYLFGEVVESRMVLNDWGYMALNEWRRLEQRFASVCIDDFVVMPNHVHGIIWITAH